MKSGSMVRALCAGALALGGLPAAADVLEVGPGAHPTIQAAVDAAVDGDTILVRSGNYAGFQVTNKALTIVADTAGVVVIHGMLNLQNLQAHKQLVLSGLSLNVQGDIGLLANGLTGPLRLVGLKRHDTGFPSSTGSGVRLVSCLDVAILGCQLIGGSYASAPFSSAEGLVVEHSNVAIYDSHIEGRRGQGASPSGIGGAFHPPHPGRTGLMVSGTSQVFVAGSTIQGGDGGNGGNYWCHLNPSSGSPGADGGTGLLVLEGSHVWLLDSELVGGEGGIGGHGCDIFPYGPSGADGAAQVGPAVALPGPMRSMHGPTLVREGETLALTFQGVPGDLLWLRMSREPGWTLELPFSGVRLLGIDTLRPLGAVLADGTKAIGFPVADLGPGVLSRNWHLQAFFKDTGGRSFHGSATVVVTLDSSF